MELAEVLERKGLTLADVTKAECFRIGQASVLAWLAELLGVTVFDCSEKAIERLFKKTE